MNYLRSDSACGRIRELISKADIPIDTEAIARAVGHSRHNVSRLLTGMRRMGQVRQVTKATVGRYGKAATWVMEDSE